LFVDSSGRVGLGTSSPEATLHTLGAAASEGAAVGQVIIDSTAAYNASPTSGIIFRITQDSSNTKAYVASIYAAKENAGDGDRRTSLIFGTRSSSGTTAERMRLDSSGRLGLGTSSPNRTLDVRGAGVFEDTVQATIWPQVATNVAGFGTNNNYPMALVTNGSQRLHITAAGLVGIGTTTVDERLHVSGGNIKQQLASATQGGFNVNNGTNDLIAIGTGGFAANGGSDTDGGIRTTNNLVFATGTGSPERARIDSSGRLLVGTSTARALTFTTPRFQVEGSGFASAHAQIFSTSNNDQGAYLTLGHSRGTAWELLQNNDTIGRIDFVAGDGVDDVHAGEIRCAVDGTPGSDDMPSRLTFSTTADGASSPTERMRITQAGRFFLQSGGGQNNGGANPAQAVVSSDEIGNHVFNTFAGNTSYTGQTLIAGCYRSANSGYTLIAGYSGDGATNAYSDREFQLRGDGNGYCDGAWTGGGADYAEYFEWSDGNPDEEDRRGISVVLDGEKVRPAEDGEDPIGVISGNPSVVGDAAWNKWSGKYLRDEYGTYIQEDYEVEDEDGNKVIQQRRKLNPAYDPDQEYINREQRPEWDCVGLMGKLRIRKGQPTGSRWIKMRDISDSAEEWLVR
jgi:hypothetical protein